MGLICKVKFQESFKDGNVYPRGIRAGEVIELDEGIVNRIIQSGGGSVLEIIEKRVPPSVRTEVVEELKKSKKAAKDEA